MSKIQVSLKSEMAGPFNMGDTIINMCTRVVQKLRGISLSQPMF